MRVRCLHPPALALLALPALLLPIMVPLVVGAAAEEGAAGGLGFDLYDSLNVNGDHTLTYDEVVTRVLPLWSLQWRKTWDAWDTNGDNRISWAEAGVRPHDDGVTPWQGMDEKQFYALDTDRDHHHSRAEVRFHLRHRLIREATAFLDALDRNHDRAISRAEFDDAARAQFAAQFRHADVSDAKRAKLLRHKGVAAYFAQHDADADGRHTREEMRAAKFANRKRRARDAATLATAKRSDLNGDGIVTKGEYLEYFTKEGLRHADDAHHTRDAAALQRHFDEVDANRDGIHQARELGRWMAAETERELDQDFAEMDEDHDGKVSEREFHVFHREL